MALNENPSLANQSAPAKKFKCLRCKKDTFKSAIGLAKHQAALGHHHVVCPVCNKEFGTEKGRDDHQRSSHDRRPISRRKKAVPALVSPAQDSSTRQEQQQNNQQVLQQGQQQQEQQQVQLLVDQGVKKPAIAVSHTSSTTLHDHMENAVPVNGPLNEVRLYYNGNFFMTLTPAEQELVYANLLTKCHSPARLQRQGYTMPSVAQGDQSSPKKATVARKYFLETPVLNLYGTRRAIVIDCEMVQVRRWQREVAFLSAVDFLTGEVLINNYVRPTGKVTDWTTRISGITPAAMAEAVARGQALNGWQSARQELYKYIDAQTILIGHSLNSDLDVLGIYHSRVVDSVILASEAVFGYSAAFKRLYSLKTLSEAFLKLHIQSDHHPHVCLEDTLATRDVVLSCLRNPEGLTVWAGNAKAKYDAEVKEREARKRQKKEQKAKMAAKQQQATATQPSTSRGPLGNASQLLVFEESSGIEASDDPETLRWSDIAEDCGWPHPDTGYDPWSD
ncbi:ribonuclease H-like domain-containing protein [Aspergillus pseudonomiae]|uniref:Ribonuclease H-like domain-containing protein n=1 Tax=Aspergillus pseudonomiae TaxID=1506151 RepID=A0A5N7D1K4_9EURO|nr:ribonuclease H-like domain-containing protein [Aspergillus pseudonomiae]KAB8256461.1 ribonuclease H-like domain-containing protein [Aspergillus pseudonomiae]KAE8400302.1 ribonuclease H-like domain-containing protein [Aspergillus pseudonomiae]